MESLQELLKIKEEVDNWDDSEDLEAFNEAFKKITKCVKSKGAHAASILIREQYSIIIPNNSRHPALGNGRREMFSRIGEQKPNEVTTEGRSTRRAAQQANQGIKSANLLVKQRKLRRPTESDLVSNVCLGNITNVQDTKNRIGGPVNEYLEAEKAKMDIEHKENIIINKRETPGDKIISCLSPVVVLTQLNVEDKKTQNATVGIKKKNVESVGASNDTKLKNNDSGKNGDISIVKTVPLGTNKSVKRNDTIKVKGKRSRSVESVGSSNDATLKNDNSGRSDDDISKDKTVTVSTNKSAKSNDTLKRKKKRSRSLEIGDDDKSTNSEKINNRDSPIKKRKSESQENENKVAEHSKRETFAKPLDVLPLSDGGKSKKNRSKENNSSGSENRRRTRARTKQKNTELAEASSVESLVAESDSSTQLRITRSKIRKKEVSPEEKSEKSAEEQDKIVPATQSGIPEDEMNYSKKKHPITEDKKQDTPTRKNDRNFTPHTSKLPLSINKHTSSTKKKLNTIEKTELKRKEEDNQRQLQRNIEASEKKKELIKAKQEALRSKREIKLQKAAVMRDALEREKAEQLVKREKEKEEKERLKMEEMRKLNEEQILKKKQLNQQKALEAEERRLKEEAARLARLKEQEEEEQRLAELRAKQQEEAERLQQQRKMEEEKRLKQAAKKGVETNKKGDSTDEDDMAIDDHLFDEEDPKDKKKIPAWAASAARLEKLKIQYEIPTILVKKFFENPSPTPDLKQFFGKNTIARPRTSSAVWERTITE